MNQNELGKQDFPKLSATTRTPRSSNASPKDRTWLYLLVIGALMATIGIAMGSNRMYGSKTSYQVANAEGIAGWILTVVGILLVILGIAVLMMRKEPDAPVDVIVRTATPVAPAPVVQKPIKGKLQELNDLLKEGLISQEEYDRKRQDLIERI